MCRDLPGISLWAIILLQPRGRHIMDSALKLSTLFISPFCLFCFLSSEFPTAPPRWMRRRRRWKGELKKEKQRKCSAFENAENNNKGIIKVFSLAGVRVHTKKPAATTTNSLFS